MSYEIISLNTTIYYNNLDKEYYNIITLNKISTGPLKNFTRRIGYGLKFLNYYRFLPSIFFIMIFYLLSPTHIKNLRLTVSATLNFLMELKYKLKEYK